MVLVLHYNIHKDLLGNIFPHLLSQDFSTSDLKARRLAAQSVEGSQAAVKKENEEWGGEKGALRGEEEGETEEERSK